MAHLGIGRLSRPVSPKNQAKPDALGGALGRL
jgi:hypothetical protein